MDHPKNTNGILIEALVSYIEGTEETEPEETEPADRRESDTAETTEASGDVRAAKAILKGLQNGRLSMIDTATPETVPATFEMANYSPDGYDEEDTATAVVDPSRRKTVLDFHLEDHCVRIGLEQNRGDLHIVLFRTVDTGPDGQPQFGKSDGNLRIRPRETMVSAGQSHRQMRLPK